MLKIDSNQVFKPNALLVFFLLVTLVCSSQTTEAQKEIYTFEEVERPPMAKVCNAKGKLEKQKKCTTKYVRTHIIKKFNMDLASDLGLRGAGIVTMTVTFEIDEQGNVKDIQATGGPEKLNEHTRQVVMTLPPFQPAVHHGKPVRVKMETSFRFQMFN